MQQEEIFKAIDNGVTNYFAFCKHHVPKFVQDTYQYPGAWHTNKHALGLDIVRAPINLIWAPIYVVVAIILFIAKFLKFTVAVNLLEKVPMGLTTVASRHINKAISNNLLNIEGHSIVDFISKEIQQLDKQAFEHNRQENPALFHDQQQQLHSIINSSLKEYSATRTASADISNTLLGTTIGAIAFKKFTPGGMGIGIFLAYLLEKKMAVSNFFLGDSLGSIYYKMFPPEPSLSLIISVTLFVFVCFSIFAAVSGIISDPIQAKIGLHQYRLRRMLNSMEKDFRNQTTGAFKPKDQYVARIMEIFDTLKTHLG